MAHPQFSRQATKTTTCRSIVYSWCILTLLSTAQISGMWFNKTAELDDILKREEKGIAGVSIDQRFEKMLLDSAARLTDQENRHGNAENTRAVLVENDILVTPEEYVAVYMDFPETNGTKRHKRNAIPNYYRWPNAELPYKIRPNQFSKYELQLLRMAMSQWEHFTCVKFRKKTHTEKNYLEFRNGLIGCSSYIGMAKIGKQDVNLQRPGCSQISTYLHELGHAIGLQHEHNSPIRDQYIWIDWRKVTNPVQFKLQTDARTFGLGYDFTSIMHYGVKVSINLAEYLEELDIQTFASKQSPRGGIGLSTSTWQAFSSDQSQTIYAHKRENEQLIQRYSGIELRFNDIKKVNLVYECNALCPANIRCRDGGFVNKDCTCFCKNGTNSCQESGRKPPQKECKNNISDEKCRLYKMAGDCFRNPLVVLPNCKKACGMCGIDFNKGSLHAKGHCKNPLGNEACSTLAQTFYCVLMPAYMMVKCPQACGFCNKRDAGACKNLYDTKDCERFANIGHCRTYREWMIAHCRRSCKVCDRTPSSCTNRYEDKAACYAYAATGECMANAKWMYQKCKLACGKCGDLPGVQCKNLYAEEYCLRYAHAGHCKSDWMIMNCLQACQKVICRGGSCHDSSHECRILAPYGHCMQNPEFMIPYCQKTCSHYICQRSTIENHCSDKWPVSTCVNSINSCGKDFRITEMCYRTCSGCGGGDKETGRECVNQDSDEKCWTNKLLGNCDTSGHMMSRCYRACSGCGGLADEGKDCLDTSVSCTANKMQGLCDQSPEQMARACRKTCGFCDQQKYEEALRNSKTRLCKDEIDVSIYGPDSCQQFSNDGQCAKNDWVRNKCKKTCGECLDSGLSSTPATSGDICRTATNVHRSDTPGDPDYECRLWALGGQCNGEYVKTNCMKTCRCYKCYDLDERQCRSRAEQGGCLSDTKSHQTWMDAHCAKTCKLCESDKVVLRTTPARTSKAAVTSGPPSSCRAATNIHKSKKVNSEYECRIWALGGSCKDDYVKKNCRKTCECCKCFDVYDSRCRTGAANGHCNSASADKKEWMTKYCSKTCKLCRVDEGCLKTEESVGSGTLAVTPGGVGVCRNARNIHQSSDKPNDPDYECRNWAAGGLCKEDYVKKNCKKTCECDKCFDADEQQCRKMAATLSCSPKSKIDKEWMANNCAKTCNRCEGNQKTSGGITSAPISTQPVPNGDNVVVSADRRDCSHVSNLHISKEANDPDRECKGWSAGGLCENSYMQKMCLKTCTCETCFDVDESNCLSRLSKGQCEPSSDHYKWTLKYCAKSCGKCKERIASMSQAFPPYPNDGIICERGSCYAPKWNDSCCDKAPDCAVLADVACFTSQSVREKCPKSCGFCWQSCVDHTQWRAIDCRSNRQWCHGTRYEVVRMARDFCSLTCGICKPCPV